MKYIPKLKTCPNCESVQIIIANGIVYDNPFKSLKGWVLKKSYKCRKCKERIGLFINSTSSEEKMVWFNYISCEDKFFEKLVYLQEQKSMFLKNKNKNKYEKISEKILKIQNEIKESRLKLKISVKIKNRMLIKQAY
tara:strand:+ start:127 stop:537 length:411 start_codon:yes stop_codon:yes gene_type:complete